MVLLIIFIIVELISVGLTSIWFAAGALIALLFAMAGAHPVVQIVVFLAVSVILLAATRPWAQKYINSRTHPTNADSLVGERIRIAERVSNLDQTGMAVVHGQEWTVRTQDDTEIIEEGQLACVQSISGVKLIVSKL
jgi:membrane protein implicated in regulation of membrane protease activity